MAKKQFTTSFQDIFSPTEVSTKNINETKFHDSTADDIQRTTILLSGKTYHIIKAIAFWERKQIKDIIDEAIKLRIAVVDSEELKKAIDSFEVYSSK